MNRRVAAAYYGIAIILFVLFVAAGASSIIAIWLAVEWEVTLEIWHYLAFMFTLLSWHGAHVALRIARKQRLKRGLDFSTSDGGSRSANYGQYSRFDGFDDL